MKKKITSYKKIFNDNLVKIFFFLNITFVIILFLPFFTSLFFELELEVRESTLWLHVLTIKNNINLYDWNQVAYANHAHGPMDPIIKFGLSEIFPFLKPWQISRLPNILLFITVYIVTFFSLKKKVSLNIIILFSSIFIALIVLFHKGYQGRADYTAIFIILIIIFLETYNNYNHKIKFILVPLFASVAILINWRFLPVVITICFYKNLEIFLKERNLNFFLKNIIRFSLIFTLIPVLILFLNFNFNIEKYYLYFIDFFYFDSHLTKNYLLSGIFSLLKVEKFFVLMLLVILLYVKFLVPQLEKNSLITCSLALFGIIATTILQYLYNYNGGGIYYFTPVILIMFFLLLNNLKKAKNVKLGFFSKYFVSFLILLVIISSSKFSLKSYFILFNNIQNTKTINLELQSLDRQKTLSESMHFFKKKYVNEKIDIGDLLSYRSKQVGGEYEKTYLNHKEDVEASKYEYIIHNFAGSSFINNLIKSKKYEIIKKYDIPYTNLREILILKKSIFSR